MTTCLMIKTPELSERQRDILVRLWNDETIKEIASALGIHEATVGTHLANLRVKFRARTTLQLCRRALMFGILQVHA